MITNQQLIDYAKIAYAAYGRRTEYKNYQGLPMPQWDELTLKIQAAWVAVVVKLVQVLREVDDLNLEDKP